MAGVDQNRIRPVEAEHVHDCIRDEISDFADNPDVSFAFQVLQKKTCLGKQSPRSQSGCLCLRHHDLFGSTYLIFESAMTKR